MQTQEGEEFAVLKIKGSSRVVSDYFEICIHNILFQRNIYPKEDFKVIRKFGLNLVFCKDKDINQYIKTILKQLHRWIYSKKINWLTLLILSKETDQITEKWMFHIDVVDDSISNLAASEKMVDSKSITETQQEIQTIIQQISSSVIFLPQLEEFQTFRILVHTTGDIETPTDWDDAKTFKEIQDGNIESVKFNTFGTGTHNISSFVTYKTMDQ
jgi:mitotic spindle assembly checkpoint protein MAD2